jgi:hypothetical protein
MRFDAFRRAAILGSFHPRETTTQELNMSEHKRIVVYSGAG